MKKKSLLIVFSIIIVIAIIFLVSYTQRNYDPYDIESENFEKNADEVLNQGTNFLKYENNLYFINDRTESIIKYDTKENIATPIVRMKDYALGNKLYIISNKLIYTVGENTYYSDLNGANTYKFTEGKLVYVNDEIYVYIVQDSYAQHLYIASYNPETFMRTNDVFFNLANGYKIRYIKAIDDILFFESENTDSSLTLFSIDLKEYKSKVITRREKNTGDAYSESEISDVIMDDRSLYFIFSDIDTTTDGESAIVNSDIYSQGIGYSISEFFENGVEDRMFYSPDVSREVVYEKYNEGTSTYEWYNTSNALLSYKWEDIVNGDVRKYFNYNDSVIYKENQSFLTLDSAYMRYNLEDAKYYYNEFYFLLSNNSGAHVWFKCQKDGNDLKKIYEWRQ